MPRIAFFVFLFLSLHAPRVWGAVSSGGVWELSRSVAGSAGSINLAGGTATLTQSVGEANGLNSMSGGVSVLLSGYLSSFPSAAQMVQQLTSLGGVLDAGTAMVLATNNSVQLQFNVDIDAASLVVPGVISVSAVMDSMGNPVNAFLGPRRSPTTPALCRAPPSPRRRATGRKGRSTNSTRLPTSRTSTEISSPASRPSPSRRSAIKPSTMSPSFAPSPRSRFRSRPTCSMRPI